MTMVSPLEGIKVLEFARVSPVALCTRILADFGAEVLKVQGRDERPERCDEDTHRRAALRHLDRNKRSIAVDLKHSAGQRILRELAAGADVIVEGFRPGVMARFGGDFATLSTLNPRLIYCSLSGFGQDGPYRDLPGHDLNYLSLAGVLGLIGEPGRAPVIPLNLIADYGGAAMHGVAGILLALVARSKTGRGQLVDVSYLDSALSLLAATPFVRDFFADGRGWERGTGPIGGSFPYYTIYETADRKLLSVGCGEPWLWRNFCKAIGREDLQRFGARAEHLNAFPDQDAAAAREEVQQILRARTREQWFEFFIDKNVCVTPVNTVEEAFNDPQVRWRGMVAELQHNSLGPIRQIGVPIKLSETPGTVRFTAAVAGGHTDEVLTSLGYSGEERKRLHETGVVA